MVRFIMTRGNINKNQSVLNNPIRVNKISLQHPTTSVFFEAVFVKDQFASFPEVLATELEGAIWMLGSTIFTLSFV